MTAYDLILHTFQHIDSSNGSISSAMGAYVKPLFESAILLIYDFFSGIIICRMKLRRTNGSTSRKE